MYQINSQNPFKQKAEINDIKNMILSKDVNLKISLPTNQTRKQASKNPEAPFFKNEVPHTHQNHHSNPYLAKKVSTPKKLYLKDYIQLNSIERKNKSRSSIRHAKTQPNSNNTSLKSSLLIDKDSNGHQTPDKNQNSGEMLKQEAMKKIEEQMKRLKDLKQYMDKKFSPHQDSSETEMFLFGLCKGLDKTKEFYTQMGTQILEFQKEKGETKSDKFFWEKDRKRLESPAKMRQALQLTFLSYNEVVENKKG